MSQRETVRLTTVEADDGGRHVELYWCADCGTLVHDWRRHKRHHRQLERVNHLARRLDQLAPREVDPDQLHEEGCDYWTRAVCTCSRRHNVNYYDAADAEARAELLLRLDAMCDARDAHAAAAAEAEAALSELRRAVRSLHDRASNEIELADSFAHIAQKVKRGEL